MTTPRQSLKRFKLAKACLTAMGLKGSRAEVIVLMPGGLTKVKKRRFSAYGPRGRIIMSTYDNKTLCVLFDAAKLHRSLEVINHDRTTG